MCPDTQRPDLRRPGPSRPDPSRPDPSRPDLRRPISRPFPPVKIQSGDKSPHSSGKRKDDGDGTLRFRF
jgi:hypothetical protein